MFNFNVAVRSCVSILAVYALTSSMSIAADVKMRVLGWYGNQPQSEKLERPFWKNLEAESKGEVSAQFRTIDELGLKGFESLRTLQSGAFDVVSFQISFVGGEAPVLLGVDLPGLTYDFDELQKVVAAYRPILEKTLETKYGGKLLAAWTFPFQILYCKDKMTGLADLRGKKVRVSGPLTADMIKQFGGAGVTLAGPEVYPALMQGVVDCAITGSQYGNSNDWFEVTKSLSVAPLGGAGVVLQVARKDFWDKLTPAQRTMLETKIKRLETDLWEMARDTHQDGINCNVGRQPCTRKPGKMTLVEVSAADKALIKKTLVDSVVPLWLQDCEKATPTCRDDWNRTVGSVVGLRR